MSTIVVHGPFAEKHPARSRHANAHFRWKVTRPWLPMLLGIGLTAGALAVMLGLGWWYVPEV